MEERVMPGKTDQLRMQFLEQVLLTLSAGKEKPRVLEAALNTAAELFNASAGSVLVKDKSGKRVRFAAVISRKPQALRRMSMGLDRGIVGWCVRNGRMLWVPDVSKDKRYDPAVAEKIGFRTKNILCGPLKKGKSVLGALELVNIRGDGPTKKEMERFRAVSDAIVGILEPKR
jgi:GAF domain-containing protein